MLTSGRGSRFSFSSAVTNLIRQTSHSFGDVGMTSDGPQRRTFWHLLLLVGCWALLSGWTLAIAQGRPRDPIQFEVDQSNWAMRVGAPVPLKLKIICSSPGIMEGNLAIQVSDSIGATIAQILIPDCVYSPGRMEVEYLLPIQSHAVQGTLGITCFFREKSGALYVSTGQITLPSRRSFVVPIVRGADSAESADDFAWLMLERWCPKHTTRTGFAPLLTLTPRIRGADLPQDALKHLPHDIVVVEAGGYRELLGPQVRALEDWVQGGGALFLQIGQDELSTEQQAFLDRLTAKNPNVLDDVVEETTLVPVIAGSAGAPIEYGFGQVWLTTERSWAGATEADRIAALGFLWRLRQEHRDALKQSGILSLNPARNERQTGWDQYGRTYNGGGYSPDYTMSMNESDQVLNKWSHILEKDRSPRPGEMIEALMPRDVQAVPVWLLSSMTLVYIAAIGFGDYIVLGQIKRRRWTWFTFPAMTLLVSLLSISTAKGYLGTSQELSVVEFRDVAEDGTICRVQRFELLFRSSSGRSVTKLDNAAFTPVARQAPRNQYSQQYPPNGSDSSEAQMVVIDGNPTAQATVTQQIEQWKPQLNRTVTFPRDQMAPLTLPTPGPGVKYSSPPFAKELETKIRESLPNVIGHVFHSDQGVFALSSRINDQEWMTCQQLMNSCQQPSLNGNQTSSGLFTLFHQISPSADTGLVDLVIATPGHEVLCVAVREANNALVIYRWRFPVP
jgi:hypothetical protein